MAGAALWIGIAGGIATVITIVPMTRNAMLGCGRALLLSTGFCYRRYGAKFVEAWGRYRNLYLDEQELIDLSTTYVPLSFEVDGTPDLELAYQVLASLTADRAVIIGDPGSGKTTLLKAWGIALVHARFAALGRKRVVPYLVPLRDLAPFLGPERGVAEYIVDRILVDQGVFGPRLAAEFFQRTLTRSQALVMLDGLDEVPDARQHEVLGAVLFFQRDKTLRRPTARARMLLTCRTQNFETLQKTWVPAFAGPHDRYNLAPLRDSEIISYLRRFPRKFSMTDGPARFMKAARDANTLDLLRAPLVLAMAVGRYADRPADIPANIFDLYHEMLLGLLERHDFRADGDPDKGLLTFDYATVYEFLRRFALHAAQDSGTFGDFTRAQLTEFAEKLAPDLRIVGLSSEFVTEIITHSGVLSDSRHEDRWHYAHRSIQEFLAAEELRRRSDGDTFLLDRSSDLSWVQATQFYAAGRADQRLDDFLLRLSRVNPELAADCLQAASPTLGTARVIVTALLPATTSSLSALATAARCPDAQIRALVIGALKDVVTDSGGVFHSARTAIGGMLPLLDSLAGAGAGEISALVPKVIARLPDDPRLVGPLWKVLQASGIQRHKKECRQIVRRLLSLVMEPDPFAELARQDPGDRNFLQQYRAGAYPFLGGIGADSNLVTLLAWADYLRTAPKRPNRFFQAKAAGRLATLEKDRDRTIGFSLCRPARFVSGFLLIAVLGVSLLVVCTHPGDLLHPFGWFSLLLLAGMALAPMLLFVAYGEFANDRVPHRLKVPMGTDEELGAGNFLVNSAAFRKFIDKHEMLSGLLGFIVILPCCAVAATPLAQLSILWFVVAATVPQLLFWSTALNAFHPDQRYYLYRPNEYVNAYDDPRSRQWLLPG